MGEFSNRHIGTRDADRKEMLDIVNAKSLDQLIDETVPSKIRLKEELNIPASMTEFEYLRALRKTAAKNKVFKSYIGLGYYNTITPSPILRNIFENPGWYTQYTPYQSEISQGRLEALLNYQTMVSDLTGFPITNASLLDEGTAVAEAMIMFFHIRNKGKDIEAAKFFVSDKCFPQTIDILLTRANPLGIEIVIGNAEEASLDANYFGVALQYPDADGQIKDYKGFIEKAHDQNIKVVMAADLMSLALITPPAELGADVAVGNTQRFGVPMGYGGPHAAYFSTSEDYKRQMPGRIIGLSIDAHDKPAYRMALQTREQHIRREKATSNICTAQALLAIMAGTYGVYHGPHGIKNIASKISATTQSIAKALKDLGYEQLNTSYFDTIKIKANKSDILPLAEKAEINFRYIDDNHISISIDETTLLEDAQAIINIFAEAKGKNAATLTIDFNQKVNANDLIRTSEYMTHPVFNSYHSETELMRYLKSLENKDLSLTKSMISLGSCTMKLNAASELLPVSWPEFAQIHPFVPLNQTEGYQEVFKDLESYLSNITGFVATSLQPNSGAQGEYTGLSVIRAFHHDNGDHHRDVVLIPASAHGTNPASAVMAGMKVVVTKCDELGNIDVADLKANVEQYKDNLAALMVTYPSTHGVFEDSIQEVCQMIHDNGGQVYMDGANMNAQVGLTSPANIGADVCHLNLHKTFAIPHGGGGPGVGTISVAKHLAPFLPGNPLIKTGGEKAIHAVSAAPWGSANIMLISYGYIKMLGYDGLKEATKNAILNANYLKNRLEQYYPILYVGENGRVAHEFIIDFRPIKAATGIEVEDVAKRLMDYSFHAPTVSFPVAGTLMIEPTESEPKAELDRFCDALISIKEEIDAIGKGTADKENNLLKNAPHTADEIVSAEWNHGYSREQAVFPLPFVKNNKFWPAVKRVNNSYGDRHLVCACPPTETYAEEVMA